jgi:hypothetical protein
VEVVLREADLRQLLLELLRAVDMAPLGVR